MTLDEFNKALQENQDVAEKYSTLLKEALKDKSKKEYPAIMSKIAADLGYDLSVEELAAKAQNDGVQELADDALDNVNGGFLLFFPWWS